MHRHKRHKNIARSIAARVNCVDPAEYITGTNDAFPVRPEHVAIDHVSVGERNRNVFFNQNSVVFDDSDAIARCVHVRSPLPVQVARIG